MSETTVIYNSETWDGKFAGQIVRFALGPDVVMKPWNPGDPAIPFPREGQVYVVGVSLSEPFGMTPDCPYDCSELWKRLVWFYNSQAVMDHTDPNVPGIRLPGVAICRLVYNWFVRLADSALGAHLDPPKESDFSWFQVTEPDSLKLLQEFYYCARPSRDAREFVAGLEQAREEINWPLVLAPHSGSSYLPDVINSGARGGESRASMDLARVLESRPPTDLERALGEELERKDRVIKTLRSKLEKNFREWLEAPEPPVAFDMQSELRRHLDGLQVTSENIGDTRRKLFVPWNSRWNSIVRDETAKRENRLPGIGVQVQPPANTTPGI
jgi:hypothetical protein